MLTRRQRAKLQNYPVDLRETIISIHRLSTRINKGEAMTDSERYALSRARDGEPLSWMHREVLWNLAARGISVCL